MEKTINSSSKKETPDVLKIIGALMCLAGAFYALLGVPLLLFFGFGIILMIFGGLTIFWGVKVYRAEKGAYIPSLVIGILALANELRYSRYLGAVVSIAFLFAIYNYRKDFVN
ncbi:MAG: hypothetical protein AAB682_02665 [Patescibacteria group bacterium]